MWHWNGLSWLCGGSRNLYRWHSCIEFNTCTRACTHIWVSKCIRVIWMWLVHCIILIPIFQIWLLQFCKILQLGKPGKGYKGGILFVILLQLHVSLYLNKTVIEYPETLKKMEQETTYKPQIILLFNNFTYLFILSPFKPPKNNQAWSKNKYIFRQFYCLYSFQRTITENETIQKTEKRQKQHPRRLRFQ